MKYDARLNGLRYEIQTVCHFCLQILLREVSPSDLAPDILASAGRGVV